MSLLTSKFNVSDGWDGSLARGAAIQEVFEVAAEHKYNESDPSATTPLSEGYMVYQTTSSTKKEAKIALLDAEVNLTADKYAPAQFWMVVSGNSQYERDGRFLQKVVCLRGNFTVETTHVKGTLTVGQPVCAEHAAAGNDATLPHNGGNNAGRLQLAAAGDPVQGRVSKVSTIDGDTVYEIEMSINE